MAFWNVFSGKNKTPQELLAAGDVKGALKGFLEQSKKKRDDPTLLLQIANLFVKVGEEAKAKEYFVQVGVLYGEAGFFNKSVAAFKKALKITPDDKEILDKLASFHDKVPKFMINEKYLRRMNTEEAKARGKDTTEPVDIPSASPADTFDAAFSTHDTALDTYDASDSHGPGDSYSDEAFALDDDITETFESVELFSDPSKNMVPLKQRDPKAEEPAGEKSLAFTDDLNFDDDEEVTDLADDDDEDIPGLQIVGGEEITDLDDDDDEEFTDLSDDDDEEISDLSDDDGEISDLSDDDDGEISDLSDDDGEEVTDLSADDEDVAFPPDAVSVVRPREEPAPEEKPVVRETHGDGMVFSSRAEEKAAEEDPMDDQNFASFDDALDSLFTDGGGDGGGGLFGMDDSGPVATEPEERSGPVDMRTGNTGPIPDVGEGAIPMTDASAEENQKHWPLFRTMPTDVFIAFVMALETVDYDPGVYIVRQGDLGDEMFLIAEGEVEVEVEIGGTLTPVARLHEGDFFGEASLLTGEPRNASVKTLSHTNCLLLNQMHLHELLKSHPSVMASIESIYYTRMEQNASKFNDEA